MPRSSSQLSGKIYDANGAIISEATITLTHTSGTVSTTSSSLGEYILNYGDLTSWSDGDSAVVSSTVAGKGTISEIISMASGGTVLNLNLAETSNLDYPDEMLDQHKLIFTLPVLFDGTKISSDNPMPVKLINGGDILDLTNNPETTWTITRSDRQADKEKIILANGDVYERTFTYTNNVLTKRSKWIKK